VYLASNNVNNWKAYTASHRRTRTTVLASFDLDTHQGKKNVRDLQTRG